LIFDDIIDSGGSSNKGEFINLINELFSRGRHFKISVMICNQYVKNVITPTVRSNIDYFFISNNTSEVLHFVHSLVIFDGTKTEFLTFVSAHTKDHHFLMYDNLSADENQYFTIRAKLEYIESKIGKNKY
jgi:hypothetical protein